MYNIRYIRSRLPVIPEKSALSLKATGMPIPERVFFSPNWDSNLKVGRLKAICLALKFLITLFTAWHPSSSRLQQICLMQALQISMDNSLSIIRQLYSLKTLAIHIVQMFSLMHHRHLHFASIGQVKSIRLCKRPSRRGLPMPH